MNRDRAMVYTVLLYLFYCWLHQVCHFMTGIIMFEINFESINIYLTICANAVHKCQLKLMFCLIKLAVNTPAVQETIVLTSKNKTFHL